MFRLPKKMDETRKMFHQKFFFVSIGAKLLPIFFSVIFSVFPFQKVIVVVSGCATNFLPTKKIMCFFSTPTFFGFKNATLSLSPFFWWYKKFQCFGVVGLAPSLIVSISLIKKMFYIYPYFFTTFVFFFHFFKLNTKQINAFFNGVENEWVKFLMRIK